MPPRRYAADTVVSVDRSKQQLEALLRDHGAEGYHAGWDQARDVVEFLWQGMQIRFVLPRPTREAFTRSSHGAGRTERQITQAMAQADRQRWRALYLVVRAKLESVESGIAVFEQEFLGFIVNPVNNQTLYEMLEPRLQAGRFDVSRALTEGGVPAE